ncbi:MAG: hypothetical protein CMH26_05525 [Micavibrio sp.]|mgnify:CR=1 FL=1|nr:hypothetical protein [Micavibrio sp.]|tara:strand:+ start:1199 stop:1690 length:492 start_codon:yes stop_codon:yes gene_type:complete
MSEQKNRIVDIIVEGLSDTASGHLLGRDRDIALRDLAAENSFQPAGDDQGPYKLKLAIEENRLVFRATNSLGTELPMLVLSLKPYARLIKDYFLIVRSYDEALRDGKPSRIEAIDMGRRGLHNEGAELLKDRLSGKIEMDFDTARRLFTLICVLHDGKIHVMR